MTSSTWAGVSPDVVTELHSAHVRQLGWRTLGWFAGTAAAAALLALMGARAGANDWFLVSLLCVQAIQAGVRWWRARGMNPESVLVTGASDDRQHLAALSEKLAARPALATNAMAGLVIAVTAFEWLTAGSVETTVARAGLVKPLVLEGEWWRLGTAVFVHANLWHLAANVIALRTFGRVVEGHVARHWVWLVFAASGLAGSLASWWLAPGTSSIGASGAAMGVIGFLAVLAWRRPQDLPAAVRSRAWMAIVGTAYVGALMSGVIDNAAHAGGAAAGALIAFFAVSRKGDVRRASSGRWLPALGWVSAAAVVLTAARAVLALASGPSAATNVLFLGRDSATPVASVSAHVDRGSSGAVLEITNHSGRRLEAYELIVHGAVSEARVWRDDCCFFSAEHKPIGRGESVRLPLGNLRFPPGVRPEVTISVVVFDDATYEGSARAHRQIVRRRQQVIDEANFWIATLDTVIDDRAGGGSRLENHVRSRRKFAEVSGAALTAYGIERLIGVARQRPDRFVDEVSRTKARILASRESLEARVK